jgi:transposase
MPCNFLPVNRDQMYLMPRSLRDWLPESHLAWFVLDAVAQMGLKAFYEKHRSDGWGGASFEPEMMVALLVYAYCEGERSSRRIERLCERDVAFRVITANQKPDHCTIARFRRDNAEELERLFTDVLRLCAEAGLVDVGVVALDGTKIRANAALEENRTYDHIREEVRTMLSEAEATDREEDARYGEKRGDELPEGLRDRKSRVERLKECQARLEREAAQAAAQQAEKIAQREAEERATGQKKRGRKPKAPDPTPPAEAKANVTEPESRILKTRSGYIQGYNAQAAATKRQIIVAADVTDEENDVKQLHPMTKQAQANLTAAGIEQRIQAVPVDAGYWSEANVLEADPEGPELFIATTKDWKQRQAMREHPPPRGRIPRGLSVREHMERKLLTRRGRRIYALRGCTIEPVFGQIKTGRGCDRFMRRGLAPARSEWRLICATHNLLKLYGSGQANWN